ncbi:hypothetical protein NDN08_006697 [Rhodosorus marinus]|uniref:YchJ-like middle NTF2-like domain-containing protein n=1 Tax=Rhodosorus marinus TaxID=101924 RepID=A0AAV8UIE6_9RHOD|nr:hypothetical protein NDN08_006697 [Rhodosorus marinus]
MAFVGFDVFGAIEFGQPRSSCTRTRRRPQHVLRSNPMERILNGIEEFVYGKDVADWFKKKKGTSEREVDRIPSDADCSCPCGSSKTYANCCRPFHKGESLPNALELLRSRYAAYYYRLPTYIMKTTHERNEDFAKSRRAWKNEITEFCLLHRFLSLEVLEQKVTQRETQFIMFRVTLLHEGVPASFIEQSKLQQDQGKFERTVNMMQLQMNEYFDILLGRSHMA